MTTVIPYILSIVSSVLATYCAFKIKNIANRREAAQKEDEDRQKAIADGIQSLLRDNIVKSYNKYMDKGFCPIYAKESIKAAYKSYHALGGNDVATELYKKILAMPEEGDHE